MYKRGAVDAIKVAIVPLASHIIMNPSLNEEEEYVRGMRDILQAFIKDVLEDHKAPENYYIDQVLDKIGKRAL